MDQRKLIIEVVRRESIQRMISAFSCAISSPSFSIFTPRSLITFPIYHKAWFSSHENSNCFPPSFISERHKRLCYAFFDPPFPTNNLRVVSGRRKKRLKTVMVPHSQGTLLTPPVRFIYLRHSAINIYSNKGCEALPEIVAASKEKRLLTSWSAGLIAWLVRAGPRFVRVRVFCGFCYHAYLATAALRTWVRKKPPLVRSMTCW